MLENSLFESQGRKKTRKPVTVVVSAGAHIVTIVVLVLIPLLQTQAITVPPVDMSLFLPRIEPPRYVEVVSAPPRIQKYTVPDPNLLTTPTSIPEKIAYVDEPPKPSVGFSPLNGTGGVGTLLIDIPNRQPEVTPPTLAPPAPPPPPAPVKAAPIRVSHFDPAALIHQVNPVYPPLAKQTHVQGIVVLEAIISEEGAIESLRVVSGHPLLTQATLDAVKQWRYRPVLLNGEPIEIITTVTVTFTLQ
jgi:protein TonB